MTNTATLAASAVLVFAYLLDVVGRRWKLPSVVLLIGTGIALRQILDSTHLHLGWVDPIVPVIGTIGLILIVLEGALDLTVSRARPASSTAGIRDLRILAFGHPWRARVSVCTPWARNSICRRSSWCWGADCSSTIRT